MKIYDGELEHNKNIESYSYLQINSCGVQFPCNTELTTTRKHGRNDYHIIYIVDGVCKIEYGDKTETVSKGGFVLYPPNMPQKYTEYQNTKKLWLHFNGFIVGDILREAQLELGIHHAQPSAFIETTITQLVTEHKRKTTVSSEKAVLMSLLFELGRQTHGTNEAFDRINDCIAYIISNYNSNLNLDEMAISCGLSKSRFMYLFKQQAGMSPHAFRLSIRIENCKNLLTSTNLDISQISGMIGYEDSLYLSRIFKKHTGVSPLNFRKASQRNKA